MNLFENSRVALCIVGVMTVNALGCAYATGTISYVEHPELATVTLATGRRDPAFDHLGPVHAQAEGRIECIDLAYVALDKLLAEAKALGGKGAREVKFRGRWNWMGRVTCRRHLFGGKSVRVQGLAVK